MKIFRFNEQRLPKINTGGKTMLEIQDYFLKDIIGIDSEKDIKVEDGEYYLVLYNDTPLVNPEFLQDIQEECENLNIAYKIGDGYLAKAGTVREFKLCENPYAMQVMKYSDISYVFAILKEYVLNKHINNDIVIYDPNNTYIDLDVEIGKGSIIHPMVNLTGHTKIGKNVVIFSYTDLIDTIIGDDTDIRSTYALEAVVGNNCTLGPFTTLRKDANIGAYCRVGDYVEIKNSNIADNVKIAHLAYVGDSDVGEFTNVGCGSVFANYNGKDKNRCKIGSNVFIGANTNLVAPIVVNDNAFIAAGSTVTHDIPEGNFCIARSRQILKDKWERK
ncbi:MAG: DapH/DapD/GlmU-related protein [Clostridia bacterium]